MEDLEQLAGRIVLIHRGRIAFDGPFDRLRREVADRRRLALVTAGGPAPVLSGAALLRSHDDRHEYVFDPQQVRLADLLAQASAQAEILDVETHRESIDDVVAGIYERWQRDGAAPAGAAARDSDPPNRD
jgi:ABC-2 type transport system ATP-binding protein